ncbi:MAG: CapA family protein [Pseudomonadota bacterium]
MSGDADALTLFLCGDVMTGRGIDQVLPHPNNPRIYEPYMKTAEGYVEIAEQKNGLIEKPAAFSYLWGDALTDLERRAVDVRIINLETAVTESGDYWQGKGINYRMHPDNISCITALGVNCCVLANNHVLDWGYAGLAETLQTLEKANLKGVGAGTDRRRAAEPAVIEVDGKGRVIVFSFACESSGVPPVWAATDNRPGVNFLVDVSGGTVRNIAKHVRRLKREIDVVVASIHWGGNWGYAIPREHRDFAHQLIDEAGVDIVHGHSSHHPKGIEVYRDKPIFYGCGDFLNDYEGIAGYEEYRGDLALMYFVRMNRVNGILSSLEMVPLQIRRFRLNGAAESDAKWLKETLDRESRKLGTRVEMSGNDNLELRWD